MFTVPGSTCCLGYALRTFQTFRTSLCVGAVLWSLWYLISQGYGPMKIKTLLSLNLVAMFAVLVVVAGPPAYAKGRALITGADVQDSSLTGADVKDGSLSGSDVQDGSITSADVDASVGRIPVETYTEVVTKTIPAGQPGGVSAQCRDTNDQVISGSYYLANDGEAFRATSVGAADGINHTFTDSYGVYGQNVGDTDLELYVTAICQLVD